MGYPSFLSAGSGHGHDDRVLPLYFYHPGEYTGTSFMLTRCSRCHRSLVSCVFFPTRLCIQVWIIFLLLRCGYSFLFPDFWAVTVPPLHASSSSSPPTNDCIWRTSNRRRSKKIAPLFFPFSVARHFELDLGRAPTEIGGLEMLTHFRAACLIINKLLCILKQPVTKRLLAFFCVNLFTPASLSASLGVTEKTKAAGNISLRLELRLKFSPKFFDLSTTKITRYAPDDSGASWLIPDCWRLRDTQITALSKSDYHPFRPII